MAKPMPKGKVTLKNFKDTKDDNRVDKKEVNKLNAKRRTGGKGKW